MDIVFSLASKQDIPRLIDLRIVYMVDDFETVTDYEKECMTSQLTDYFARKLGDELVAFIAKDGDKIVSVAYLHIIEMPANSILLNGLYGKVLSVYTLPEYRRNGLCSRLMENLIEYGRMKGLGRIDLDAREEAYPIYKRLGFKDVEHRYISMRYVF